MNQLLWKWKTLAIIVWVGCWWLWDREHTVSGLLWLIFCGFVFAMIPARWWEPPFRARAYRNGDEFVFAWKRGLQQRVPVAQVASYNFDAVWTLQLTMKDGALRRINLPSLSLKLPIQKLMRANYIPFSNP